MAKIEKLGVQLYTIRDYLNTEEDAKKSFERLKALGFDEAQTAGCAIPFASFGKLAHDAGIEIVGTHEDFNLMYETPEKAIEIHELLGTKIMGIGGFGANTLQDYLNFIDKANKVCENIGPKGYKFTYHNHSHEFIKYYGKTAFEYLMEGLDPKYASFCLDTYWVQHGGADVRATIEKLAGRIDILHLKDMERRPDNQYITQIGSGNLYWKGIIETALDTGIKHFIVEQDCNWIDNDPFKSLKLSSDFIHERFM